MDSSKGSPDSITPSSPTTKSLSDTMEDALSLSNTPPPHISSSVNASAVTTASTSNSKNDNATVNVTQASYPLPAPLRRILQAAIFKNDESSNAPLPIMMEMMGSSHGTVRIEEGSAEDEKNVILELEGLEEGISQLISNCFHALDAMYFATPGHIRNKPTFAHRQCLRVSTSEQDQTLTITDLGSGMTRADLINLLGVGRPLSQRAKAASDYLGRGSKTENDDKDDDEDPAEEESEEESDYDSEEEEEEADQESQGGPMDNTILIPCKQRDIGGFYAALCSLGTSIHVGTKSKFDDYYEFQVMPSSSSDNNSPSTQFQQFYIRRPMEEGCRPTVHNGYTEFCDVRGDCGTKIILKLNEKAMEAGYLDEQKVLKPLFVKLLEKSQYTVAFSTDDAKSVSAIIQASDEEDEEQSREAAFENDMDFDSMEDPPSSSSSSTAKPKHNTVLERAKYIPLRLSLGERKMLRLMEATMACSDYTTLVDSTFKSKARRTHTQLQAITAVLRGMVSSCDYTAGQTLFDEGNYSDYQDFFGRMFEIARRHKIMNPEKMRTEYGKLIYLLQDAVSPTIQPHLGFSVKGPIVTVYQFLQERNGLNLLRDGLIETATQEILAEKKSRTKIQNEIKRKEKAVAHLKTKYLTMHLSSEDIHLCLYSICDNNSFLNSNRVPIDKVIGYLEHFFSPTKIEKGYSLSILSGKDGARLSHNHERQYYFALQSLTLWRDIVDDMFRLWHMEEEDLLSDSVTYSLKDTGQGMQRIQQSPRTYKAMQTILARVQGKVNMWIGSSVIHLGDHNVPNALSFIDKYTQVPRILGPIVVCLENLERICDEDDGIDEYISTTFGGLERVKKDILYDFFRSAFDGSGADNFYDAGSCIDGRLTSAWNWCSQLPTKKYYSIFKLTGFIGFDGEFK